jgi:uncharacterized beta-barrel protein YwiB (DUF1934 family)
MYSVTITRVKPNTETQFYLQKSQAYLDYYNEHYAINSSWTVSSSNEGLTLTVIRTSEDQTVLQNFVNEFSNTDSPMYESTVYEKENGITTTFSEITSV